MPAIGAHIDMADPLPEAEARGADLVQIFLADPQGFKTPKPPADAAAIKASDIDIVVHAPYIVNVATLNNRIRIPSRKLLHQHAKVAAEVGAIGIVVHGGHIGANDDPMVGIDNWRKLFARAKDEGGFGVPVLIENTAGGDNAMARELDRLAMLWEAIGEYDPGFCLDTCHAWAAGIELADVVDKITAITGRIDVVHANNSRDEFGSSRDRHANLDSGQIDAAEIAGVVKAAGAPTVLETPGGVPEHIADITLLRKLIG
jgi:deoxyribonuclease IV